jgi:hypothetical protein
MKEYANVMTDGDLVSFSCLDEAEDSITVGVYYTIYVSVAGNTYFLDDEGNRREYPLLRGSGYHFEVIPVQLEND